MNKALIAEWVDPEVGRTAQQNRENMRMFIVRISDYHPDVTEDSIWSALDRFRQDVEFSVTESAQQGVQPTGLWDCTNCENRQIGAGFNVCPNCDTPRA